MPESTVYVDRPQGALRLHIHRPTGGPDRRTAILQIHGGGWRAGRPEDLRTRSEAMAAHGFCAIAVTYRLVGIAPWPAALHDVMAAIDWAREHALELGIDEDRVALQGFSAGSQIAMLAAASVADQSGVLAVLASYPPATLQPNATGYRVDDLTAPVDLAGLIRTDRGRGLPAWMLLGAGDDARSSAGVSPLAVVRVGYPPTMLVHGLMDRIVPASESRRLFESLVQHGVRAELHLLAGVGHEFDAAPSWAGRIAELAAAFLAGCARLDGRDEEQDAYNPLYRLQTSLSTTDPGRENR